MRLEPAQAGLQGLALQSWWQGGDLGSLCGGLVHSSTMWFPQVVQTLAVDVMVPWQQQEWGWEQERERGAAWWRWHFLVPEYFRV